MGRWTQMANMMDLGRSAGVIGKAMKSGGMLSAFSAFFKGADMGRYGKAVANYSTIAPARKASMAALRYHAESNLGTAALRVGLTGAAGFGSLAVLRSTKAGRDFSSKVGPTAAGIGMYAGVKRGLGAYADYMGSTGILGSARKRAGIAGLVGLAAWKGLGG